MLDTILYRRFMLVSALIAAIGVLVANVIQETRSPRPMAYETRGEIVVTPACAAQRKCEILAKPALKMPIG